VRIGIFLRWDLGSLERRKGNVLGDELYARSLAAGLSRTPGVRSAQVYTAAAPPPAPLDVAVHFNDTPPEPAWARRHLLYLQNVWSEGSERKLEELRRHGYDGYAFISQVLLDRHLRGGHQGIFLPFGVDTAAFAPGPQDPALAWEVAYVGNDIKGEARSNAYLLPAARYRFGLYGNWQRSFPLYQPWRFFTQPGYRRVFQRLSQGKIPQEQVPVLYRSAAINLNCSAEECVTWDVITLRSLEVLACGGFLLSDKVPSAERLLGDAVVFTSGHADLERQIDYHLSHEAERAERARHGCELVRSRFSIDAVARQLAGYAQGFA
jgi:spore maturation protein CgeB